MGGRARGRLDVKYLNRFWVHPGDKVRLKDIVVLDARELRRPGLVGVAVGGDG
jgi:hypothetical protein